MLPTLRFNRNFYGNAASLLQYLPALLALCSLVTLVSCGGGGNSGGGGGGKQVQTFTVVLSPTLPVIATGSTEQFTGSTVDNTTGNPVTTSGLTYAYTSSNTSVATIDMKSGLATAVGVGTTMIQVTATNLDSSNGVEAARNNAEGCKPARRRIRARCRWGRSQFLTPRTGLGSGAGATPVTWSLVNGTTLPAGLTFGFHRRDHRDADHRRNF